MKIILSNVTKGAFEGVVKELKENFDGAEHIFIVPDRFSMSMEKSLLKKLGKKACFNLEVVTFNRLAKKLLGQRYDKCLTPEGSVMLLQNVIRKNAEKLKYFGKVAKKVGFARELYASLTEFRNSGVSAKSLKDAALKMKEGFKERLLDTAFLLGEYENALGGDVVDSTTRLTTLAEKLKTETLSQNFYVCGFSSFKAPEMKIIESLAKNANSLTVGIVNGAGNKNGRIYPIATQKALEAISDVKVEKVWHSIALPPHQKIMAETVFSYSGVKNVLPTDKVVSVVAHDPFDEIKWLAVEISKLIRSGARYLDIAVGVSQTDGYTDAIDSVFKRFDIPHFIDCPRLVADTLPAKYLLGLLKIKTENYDFYSVNDFVKNPLFGIETFEFENYCLKYSIDYVTKPFTYGDFENAEKVRAAFALKAERIPEKAKGSEFANILISELKEVLSGAVASDIKAQSSENAEILKLAEKKIEDVLLEYRTIASDEEISVDDFYQTFSASLSQLKFSILPLFIDSVFVGDVNESKIYDCKYLFIVGAKEGTLPTLSKGGMIVTSQIEDALSSFGLDLNQSAKAVNQRRMMSIIDLLVAPSEKLYITRPLSDFDKSPTKEANVLNEIKSIFKIEETDFDETERKIYAEENYDELALRFNGTKNCEFELMGMLNENGGMVGKVRDYAYSRLSEDKKKRLASINETRDWLDLESPMILKTTSVSKLEKFYGCPYAYYFAYTLGLKRREEMQILTTETGTIIHDVLEKYFDPQTEIQDVGEFVELQFQRILSADRFKAMLDGIDGITMIKRLKKECIEIVEDLKAINDRSEFKPCYVEASFDDDGEFKPITLETEYGKVKLIGKIDRVDCYGGYALVIDYKSFRSADISIGDVYFGKKIQLYTYLNALCSEKGLSPAGAFYLPLFNAYTSTASDSRYKLKGQVLCDKDIIKAIDSECYDKSVSILDLTVKQNGEFNDKEDLISSDAFKTIMNYSKKIAIKGVELIEKGFIKASPVKDKCKVCDYYEICKRRGEDERVLPNVKIDVLTSENESSATEASAQGDDLIATKSN